MRQRHVHLTNCLGARSRASPYSDVARRMSERPASQPGTAHASVSKAPVFSQAQLIVLRNQILAFRHIKNGERVPATVLAGSKSQPLLPPRHQPQQQYAHLVAPHTQPGLQQQQQQQQQQRPLAAPVKLHQPGRPLYHIPGQQPAFHLRPAPHTPPAVPQVALQPTQPAQVPLPQPGVTPPPKSEAPKPALPPVPTAAAYLQLPQPVPCNQLKGPLYTLASAEKQPTEMTVNSLLAMRPQPAQQALNFSVAEMMRQEAAEMVESYLKSRIAHLEHLLATQETCPGFVARDGKLPKGSLMLELRKLRLHGLQAQMRSQVEKEQADIMNMGEKAYRKFVASCQNSRPNFDKLERNKPELVLERVRGIRALRAAMAENAVREKEHRLQRNRHVARLHERWARQHSKLKDDDRTRRMDALRANDFEAYQELLREQGAAEAQGERYEVITRFLNETEEYLHKLAGKVSNVKLQQQASEAYAKATAEARAMGFTEEEVVAAATQAAKDAATASELANNSQLDVGDAQARYYSLAHSVEEVVKAQPAMLRGPFNASLREYQLVGLQWMVSLYNNHLNGILADEMGLGKTVQVMALLAYLMENKNVFGPHLIIVPNAVIVNWKAELTQWLPEVRCVFYVGNKDDRARMYASEVQALQFNVLVTTYEFIMRDRAKLSKVDWKYLIIDEAQRMKDRQSKLAQDLDRFTAQRRLLLTGTPLQNELRELWSLLNLLLPEVFDDKSTFTEWFGDSLGKGTDNARQEDEWLETEKRVVVIHRLHQILEPFMLRRQVEDVESKLPPKVSYTVKVAMPPYQANIYNWIKATGTIKADPSKALPGKPFRKYINLNNKCMELRKVCNHPALTYVPEFIMDGIDLVQQCGKLGVLDRMLVKLHASGHRVLLFSTMTRLLNLLEHYLRWRTIGSDFRRMGYLRIDGSTALEDREKAIKQFNDPNSEAFIFLLSIRAAGRGLNLQSADTVIIYDPDPNPKNEEQAIARSHRIGQTKEVRVFHMEAVADAAPDAPAEGEAARVAPSQRKYAESIESLMRNSIQKTKIDMANEVIDAGRFNMSTTQEERKETLEALLQDEERMKKAVNKVPTAAEMNRMLARSPQEVDLFDKMDARSDWPTVPTGYSSLPEWLLFTEEEVAEVLAVNSKTRQKGDAEAVAAAARDRPRDLKRRRGTVHYTELDSDDGEYMLPNASRMSQDPAAGREISVSRSIEPSALLDNDDMEEEDIDGSTHQLRATSLSAATDYMRPRVSSFPRLGPAIEAERLTYSNGQWEAASESGRQAAGIGSSLDDIEEKPNINGSFAGTALSADQPYGPSLKREDGLEEWKARKRKEKKRKAERGRQPSDVTFSYHHQGPIDPEFKEEATSPSDSIPQKKIKLKIKLQPSGGDQP